MEEETTESTTEDTSSVQGLQTPGETIIPPKTIEEVRKPTYVPEGVIEDMVMKNDKILVLDYYLNNDNIYSFSQEVLSKNITYVDNDDVVLIQTTINNYNAQIVENKADGLKFIIWTDGEYIYQITSYIYERKELINIAESVK